MIKTDEKLKLLKAKIAVALQDEYQRVPTEQEIESVFHLTRVMYKAVSGFTTGGRNRKRPGSSRYSKHRSISQNRRQGNLVVALGLLTNNRLPIVYVAKAVPQD